MVARKSQSRSRRVLFLLATVLGFELIVLAEQLPLKRYTTSLWIGIALPAQAQIDPGNFDILQNGRKVGEIFVSARAAGQTNYVEHRVLFSDYVYPDSDLSLKTKIKASRRTYTSEEDFFARVAWGAGLPICAC